jgi:hypothetical protein
MGIALMKEKKITAVSVDFKNAYNSDPRMQLMGKLQATGGETQNTKMTPNKFITQCFCVTKFEKELSKYKSEEDCPGEKVQARHFLM